jgi:hypothetical protein
MSIRDEIAAQLNGSEYPLRISKDISEAAKLAGVVIVYGASDDLMEFDGAIHDEIGAYEGATAYLTKDGLLQNECEDEDCPHFAKMKASAATIEALWDNAGYSWTYKTSIPHATFEVVEDGEKYCRGVVFNLADARP